VGAVELYKSEALSVIIWPFWIGVSHTPTVASIIAEKLNPSAFTLKH
jgi:hypothetical protein